MVEQGARELVARMTDAAIDEAMHLMPAEWYAIDGAQMTKDLRQRRDGLVGYARKFYLHLADRGGRARHGSGRPGHSASTSTTAHCS